MEAPPKNLILDRQTTLPACVDAKTIQEAVQQATSTSGATTNEEKTTYSETMALGLLIQRSVPPLCHTQAALAPFNPAFFTVALISCIPARSSARYIAQRF